MNFKQVNNPFLNKLKNNTECIKKETKLLIAADKTMSFYKLELSKYNDLLQQNITKSYKKVHPNTIPDIHTENKKLQRSWVSMTE